MSFGHPSQQSHKLAGFAKAAKSSKTPAHLRTHLTKLSQGVPLKNDSDAESAEPETDELPMFYGKGKLSLNHKELRPGERPTKVRQQPRPKGPTSPFYGDV